MSLERNKKRKDVPELTIFEERKVHKVSAKEVLRIAKLQEEEKKKNGYHYVPSPDGKTHILTKTKKK
tara:strand:- start:156 stop:356 length:201 start_codon:yes stop_codon:yes gene_type:complete